MKWSAAGSSRVERALSALAWTLAVLVCGCSVGKGSGEVSGIVTAKGCMTDEDYDMKPSFFSAYAIEDQLVLRVQRGSDFEDKSDGFIMLIRDATTLRENQIGAEVAVGRDRSLLGGPSPPIQMTLYLNDTCPIGTAHRKKTPAVFEADSGSVTFKSIYAPEVNNDSEIQFSFDGLVMLDPTAPEDRHAVISGDIKFLYSRGRPAQRFP